MFHTIADLATLEVSPFIRRCMVARADAAGTLKAQISAKMSEAYDALHDETCSARKTGFSSDDLSKAMMPFFSKIETLQNLPGSTVWARELANCSYSKLELGGSGYGDRPSDLEVDFLLEELSTKRKKEDAD